MLTLFRPMQPEKALFPIFVTFFPLMDEGILTEVIYFVYPVMTISLFSIVYSMPLYSSALTVTVLSGVMTGNTDGIAPVIVRHNAAHTIRLIIPFFLIVTTPLYYRIVNFKYLEIQTCLFCQRNNTAVSVSLNGIICWDHKAAAVCG